MKRTLFCSIAVILFATAAMAQGQDRKQSDSESQNKFRVTIGFRSYYAWWDPVWSRIESSKSLIAYGIASQDLNMMTKADFLFNPVIAFQFNARWSLSGSYSYGHYTYKTKIYGYQPSGSTIYLKKHNNDVSKHDADLLANFSVKPWLKLIFGLRYQGYIIENKIRSINSVLPGVEIPLSDNIRFHSGGGGLGLGFSVPLGAGFYFTPGLSGIVMVGKDFAEPSGALSRLNSTQLSLGAGINPRGYQTFVITGAMGSLSFAYYIQAIRLTIEAGGRCQFLYYTEKPRIDITQRYDLFFGPYLGVAYSFM